MVQGRSALAALAGTTVPQRFAVSNQRSPLAPLLGQVVRSKPLCFRALHVAIAGCYHMALCSLLSLCDSRTRVLTIAWLVVICSHFVLCTRDSRMVQRRSALAALAGTTVPLNSVYALLDLVKRAHVSTCRVCGNMSTAQARSILYPATANDSISRTKLSGLQAT